jgi:nucleoside-diphosphate-sugar epimerase
MKAEKVLVTGAAGWLGGRLVEYLRDEATQLMAARGQTVDIGEIRCLVQPGSAAHLPKVRDTQVFEGDIRDPATLVPFFEGAQGGLLFHSAGLIHPRLFTREFKAVNVEGTRNVIAAAERVGVRRMVHVSSNSPVGCNAHTDELFDETSGYNPYMGYGRSKKIGEDLVNAAGARGTLETVIIRPPWFYGPRQPMRQTVFFQMVRDGRFPLLGSGSNRRSMAYVDNICQGLVLAGCRENARGQTYWIADREPHSMKEIISKVATVLREDFGIKVKESTTRVPSFIGDIAYAADRTLQGLGLYFQKIHVLSEMNKTISCSIEKARRELGFDPKIDLREGMRRSVEWVLAQGVRL